MGQKKKGTAAYVGTTEFTSFCEAAFPQVAAAIDSKDGFCTLEDVQSHPQVKEAIANPPANCQKVTVKVIMEQYPDFISFFEGGRVATAKGYDNGYVNADGTVNAAAVKKKKKGNKSENAGNTQPQQQPPPVENSPEMQAFDKLLEEFQKVLKNGTDKEMEQQFNKVSAERKKLIKSKVIQLPVAA